MISAILNKLTFDTKSLNFLRPEIFNDTYNKLDNSSTSSILLMFSVWFLVKKHYRFKTKGKKYLGLKDKMMIAVTDVYP